MTTRRDNSTGGTRSRGVVVVTVMGQMIRGATKGRVRRWWTQHGGHSLAQCISQRTTWWHPAAGSCIGVLKQIALRVLCHTRQGSRLPVEPTSNHPSPVASSSCSSSMTSPSLRSDSCTMTCNNQPPPANCHYLKSILTQDLSLGLPYTFTQLHTAHAQPTKKPQRSKLTN